MAVVCPSDSGEIVRLAARDASALLIGALNMDVPVIEDVTGEADRVHICLGGPCADTVISAGEREGLPQEGYRIRSGEHGGSPVLAVAGGDAGGLQYGLYDLLERMGFGFFHPEQTFAPAPEDLVVPDSLDVFESPGFDLRGYHFHTMHPLPWTEILLEESCAYLGYAQNLVDWIARNRQNYMEWSLLRTVDPDRWIDCASRIADYAHSRGVKIGISASFVFTQQKSFMLVPDARRLCEQEFKANLDWLMTADWDMVNFEMGASEFIDVSDELTMDWMNISARYLNDAYDGTQASVKIHCTTDQWSDTYGCNFNFIPQYADPLMGIYPHTVMMYGLEGTAPVYGNPDFGEIRNFMFSQIGKRKVYYYPETAYWCSFDIDVPLFFPVYLYNRWKDVVLLAGTGIEGQVDFNSGHEWGYWLSDWALNRYMWDPTRDWTEPIRAFASIFGQAATPAAEILEELVLFQQDALLDRNMIGYQAGEDPLDDLGWIVGIDTHPRHVSFKEVYRMDAQELARFEAEELTALAEITDRYLDLHARFGALADRIPAGSLAWYDEMLDSLDINRIRAEHARALYAGTTAMRTFELGLDPEGEARAGALFEQALRLTDEAIARVRDREGDYRYPLYMSTLYRDNYTSYPFGYLWQASTGYYYWRRNEQAINKNFNPLLGLVYNPFDQLF